MISYIGGKSKISKFIIPHIPKDIKQYVEVFGGMMWVYFKMDLDYYNNLEEVIYNDYNKLNVNLFNCVKNYNDFYSIIKDIKSQDSNLFYSFQEELFSDDFKFNTSIDNPDFKTGYKYVYLLTQVWSGLNPNTFKFINLKGKYKSKFDSFKNKLLDKNYQLHFDKITKTENVDFEDFIKKYDNNNLFLYADPPYYNKEKYYSNHNFDIDTHERLLKVLINMKGKFIVSYYEFELLNKWFPRNIFRWYEKKFIKISSGKKGIRDNKGIEIIILNY